MSGIAGDSSPTRGGALGLPLGVGSELPVPCSSSCVLVTPAPAQLMGHVFFLPGIAATRPTGLGQWILGRTGLPTRSATIKDQCCFVPDGCTGAVSVTYVALVQLHLQENKN